MNPIAYILKPKESLRFLLIGEMVYYRDGKEPERVWHLNIYASVKSRYIASRKLKRQRADIIFIEWNITMEQIVKQGKLIFPMAPEKILQSDKIDIWQQMNC